MGSKKTKEILVDAARQLFANKGVVNTTMNDIAQASQKGRRTLYTYFKNKDDIYFAVIETELAQVANKLSEISKSSENPEQKLITYIYTRMDAIKEVVLRNGNLNADFFLDIRKVERVRRKLDRKERLILSGIFQDGLEQGLFKVKDVTFTAMMFQLALRGLEVHYILGGLKELLEERKDHIIDFIFNGLAKNNPPESNI